MNNIKILWVDDEIELLKSQIIFLREKGYDVVEATNGTDALDKCREEEVDVVFLDENMPGISGLETLSRLKEFKPQLPVVMITKSEEENIMDEAIGGQIRDYLIKPVKPSQVLLALKKIIDNKRLVSEKNTSAYQQDFQKIFTAVQSDLTTPEWVDVYKKLVRWELELERSKTLQMKEVLSMQKTEANRIFCKYVIDHYQDWINGKDSPPVMSHTLMEKKILPNLASGTPTFFVLIDNLRFDQWKVIEPLLNEQFRVKEEDIFFSILPTSTQYSRNALFAGMPPLQIERNFPKFWRNDEDEGGKNMHEKDLLAECLRRHRKDIKFDYVKITNLHDGNALVENIHNFLKNDLTVIVYNFIDMLSHARTEMEVIKELAGDEAAYRSLTYSWFEHSPLLAALKRLAGRPVNLMIATDHGTIRVNNPSKVLGDRNTTSNLRYKTGKNLQYNPKEVYSVRDPHAIQLPRQHVSSSFIFARENDYFVYPNNYNHFVNYYKNTFQHGGISLEEVMIPFCLLSNR